eukprot:Ihof_evm12s70 gene=Ihof_evmTU12s70
MAYLSRKSTGLLIPGLSINDVRKLNADSKCTPTRPLLVVMVGLPARGKSFLSKKTTNYLNWKGIRTRIFNVGAHRRVSCLTVDQKSNFFSNSDLNAVNIREKLAYEVLQEALTFLATAGDVAFFDVTNTTCQRRSQLLTQCAAHKSNPFVIFAESICDDPQVLKENFQQKITNSEDYNRLEPDVAMADLIKRVANYEMVYETIVDNQLNYIKLINMQTQVIINRCKNAVAQSIISYLMSLRVTSRPVYLTRAGYSHMKTVSTSNLLSHPVTVEMSVPCSKLNLQGRTYARALPLFFQANHTKEEYKSMVVYTSPVMRCINTASYLPVKAYPRSALNCLDLGVYRGLSLEQFEEQMPEEFAKFIENPFNFRLDGAETLSEFINNMEPVVKEIEESTSPVLVISHGTTLQ